MASSLNKPKLIVNGKRIDGRDFNELRPLKIEAGVLKNADGSAYEEWGNNKVLAAVYGPKEAPRYLADPEKAVIRAKYSMASFSGLDGHGRSAPSRREVEISKVTSDVFSNIIEVSQFPNSVIEIDIEILQSDGGTRAAGITAASVALANAGIPMKDLVYAVSGARIEDKMAIDVNMIEDNYSDADIPFAISPRNNEVLLLQFDGGVTPEQMKEAEKLVLEAGKTISKIQKDALKKSYEDISAKYEKK